MRKNNFPEPLPIKKIKNEEVSGNFPGTIDEDEYLESLTKIIRRDFFPSLVSDDNEEISDKSKLKLNEFLESYNSDDNESFKELVEQDKKAWIEKFWWLGNSSEVEKSRLLPLENAEKEGKTLNYREKPLEVTDYEEKNNLMFEPTVELRSLFEFDSEKKVNPENTRITNPEEEKITLYKKIISKHKAEAKLETPDLMGLHHNKEKFQGYSLISMPSPSPSSFTSPLVTWGQKAGTPKLVRDDRFSMQRKSDKEHLQEMLLDNFSKKKKESQRASEDRVKSLLHTPGRISSGLSSSRLSLGGSSVLRKIFDDKSVSGRSITPLSFKSKGKTDGLLEFN